MVSNNVNVYWNGCSFNSKPSLIPYIARILAVPRTFLIPMILFFSVTGIYLMSFNNFDIFLMIGIGVATILRLYDFPMPPLILAVLGGLMEEIFEGLY